MLNGDSRMGDAPSPKTSNQRLKNDFYVFKKLIYRFLHPPTTVKMSSTDVSRASNNKWSTYIGFDLDHTLIRPKSGNIFPVDRYDWIYMYPNVKEKLK